MKRRTVTRPLMVNCPWCGRAIPATVRAPMLICPRCERTIVIQGRKAKAKGGKP